LVVLGTLFLIPTAFAQNGLSHVRVVRLSYVSGTVAVRRPASSEWAKAPVNTPIEEGFELATSGQSYAEVEFENGSTARLGEFSKLSFEQLAMNESGDKLNRLVFEQGYATFHLLPEHHDAYSVTLANTTLTPAGKSKFRTDWEQNKARVEVFSGSVEMVSAAGKTARLGKERVVEFDAESADLAMNARQGIVRDSWDQWTSRRDSQTQLSLADQAVGATGPLYGWGDLGAYGEWGYFPGFGYGWSPFAAAGWSPFTQGLWSWYPGMGYTWISSEPWGWLPYHYGSWNYAGDFGWFWMPGEMEYFSPALVSWYSGSGRIGWAPLGGQTAARQNIVTTVPASVVQNGLAVTPASANHVALGVGSRIKALPFQPAAGAMISGTPLTGSAETLFTPQAGTTHSSAPAAVLMGGTAERESALLGGRFNHQPLRARLGTTLGGTYAVTGAVGEFRGEGSANASGSRGEKTRPDSRGAETGGPTLLPHGRQAGASRAEGTLAPNVSGGGGNIGGPAPAAGGGAGHPAGPGGGGHH
jgi:hypothetical protein